MAKKDKWTEAMELAEKYDFIIYSYGGVAVLATHEVQDRMKNKDK